MALVDGNGEPLSGWETGRLEVLTELINALGDYVDSGDLTMDAAVKVYAQTAELTVEEATELLTGLWADDMAHRLSEGF